MHRALVAQGYWNDPENRGRYKPLPGREPGLVLPEIAVFSGDTVRMDEEGFLYFIGRRDEMIKVSGYRVSPRDRECCTARNWLATAIRRQRPGPLRGRGIGH